MNADCARWSYTNLVVASAGEHKSISLSLKSGRALGALSFKGKAPNSSEFAKGHKDHLSTLRRTIRLTCQQAEYPTVLSAGDETPEIWPQSFPQNQSLPPVLPKRKKRPYVIPRKKLSKKEKELVEELRLRPPENGMLVEELIPVAHNVMAARSILYGGVRELLKVFPIYACELAKRIRHEDRFKVDRLPAVIELCIQAGVDIPEYLTLRRTQPIQRSTDELDSDDWSANKSLQLILSSDSHPPSKQDKSIEVACESGYDKLKQDVERGDQWERKENTQSVEVSNVEEELQTIANRTLQAWSTMRKGVQLLMKRYPVKACGYCPEVHVGPCGHGARVCGEYKHQWRDGQHGWQEAALDDIIPPKFVWHVRDKDGPPLANALRNFYGQAPAVVELCVQAGAKVPDFWKPMMRLDVVIPALEEVEAVA